MRSPAGRTPLGPLTNMVEQRIARSRILSLINSITGGLSRLEGGGFILKLELPGLHKEDGGESVRDQFKSPVLGALARSLQIIDELGGDADPFVVMGAIRDNLSAEDNFGLSKLVVTSKVFPMLALMHPRLLPPMMHWKLLDPRTFMELLPKGPLARLRSKLPR